MNEPTVSRREKLLAMLEQQPEDLFLRYALALELDKESEHDQALKIFQKLMSEEPPYVPAFFMAGQMLSRLDRNEEARPILVDGIRQARTQGNSHAAAEMQGFLEMIED